MENTKETLEQTLIKALRDINLKQAELDELKQQVQKLESDVMIYKEAADDRWERLKFYEKNKFLKKVCSLNIRLKKRKKEVEIEEKKEERDIEKKYYSLYSKQEKKNLNGAKKRYNP